MTFIYFEIQLEIQNREIEFVLRSVPVVYHNNLGRFYVLQSFIAWELVSKNFLNEFFINKVFLAFDLLMVGVKNILILRKHHQNTEIYVKTLKMLSKI